MAGSGTDLRRKRAGLCSVVRVLVKYSIKYSTALVASHTRIYKRVNVDDTSCEDVFLVFGYTGKLSAPFVASRKAVLWFDFGRVLKFSPVSQSVN